MDGSRLLADLDADQRRAVVCESRLVAVIAGAGSGKTRVLTRRVAHRVAVGTADARHTLVLTFTREAAGELRRRLPALGLRERVEAGTFHSVMLGLLRQRWADQGRPAPNVTTDRRRLVAESSGRAAIDDVVAEIDWASARGITPDQYATRARHAGRRPRIDTATVAERFEAYRQVKHRRGVVDLDDLLVLAAEALTRDPDFAAATRWRYRHLLVDEAQDLNPLQHRLVDLLREGSDDLFLVGDPAQAIYAFNGADPALLTDVSARFPAIEIIRLPTNHRSTPQVVEAGLHVLAAGGQPTVGVSSRADGHPASVREHPDEEHEADAVGRAVHGLDPSLVRAGSVAVLARTHAQLVGLRSALEQRGVPLRRRLDGPGSPYRDAIGAAARLGSAARLRAWAHDLLDALDAGGGDVEVRLHSEEQRQVALAVLEFLREQPLGNGAAFRGWVNSTDPFGVRRDQGVDLLTFHAAKGREWHTVFVTGVETGLVPHRSATVQAAKAEEARLLYVALTRATDHLVVTWASRRGGYQRRVSPLLEHFEPTTPLIAPPPAALAVVEPRRREQRAAHDRLVEWRAHAARAAGILPEAVCSSAALRALASEPPRDPEQFAAVSGLGILTARRLFPGLLEAVSGETPLQSRRSTSTGA